jgi:hypothetical protein
MPYLDITNDGVMKMVQRGSRIERPEGCPKDVYEVMLRCWHEKPEDRPPFDKLHAMFESIVTLDSIISEELLATTRASTAQVAATPLTLPSLRSRSDADGEEVDDNTVFTGDISTTTSGISSNSTVDTDGAMRRNHGQLHGSIRRMPSNPDYVESASPSFIPAFVEVAFDGAAILEEETNTDLEYVALPHGGAPSVDNAVVTMQQPLYTVPEAAYEPGSTMQQPLYTVPEAAREEASVPDAHVQQLLYNVPVSFTLPEAARAFEDTAQTQNNLRRSVPFSRAAPTDSVGNTVRSSGAATDNDNDNDAVAVDGSYFHSLGSRLPLEHVYASQTML